MKKEFLALLLAATMMIAVFGTVSATAHSAALPTTDRHASFTGSYTGLEVARTADSVAVTSTNGKYSGSAMLHFTGNTITGDASGTGNGQFHGSKKGPYTATIQASIEGTLTGKSVDGTFSAVITIAGTETAVRGPLHGTLEGSKMNVQWSSQVVQQDGGSSTVTTFRGLIKFELEPPA
jgi:hypothetical protein